MLSSAVRAWVVWVVLLGGVGSALRVQVTAGGGAGTVEHGYGAGDDGGGEAVRADVIFPFGTFLVREAKHYRADRGITIRP